MRIVRARPEDALVVAALSLQFAIAVDGSREEGYLHRAATHWLAHHEQLPTWIAEHDGEHAGYLQATYPPETTWPGQRPGARGRLWVHAVYVPAEHRRRGLATALITACEDWARGAGVQTIRLRCTSGAEAFCAANGYATAPAVREKRLR